MESVTTAKNEITKTRENADFKLERPEPLLSGAKDFRLVVNFDGQQYRSRKRLQIFQHLPYAGNTLDQQIKIMPREEVTNAIKNEIEARNLPQEAGDRILAFLKQAESSEFPNRDREEQLALILDALSYLGPEQEDFES